MPGPVKKKPNRRPPQKPGAAKRQGGGPAARRRKKKQEQQRRQMLAVGAVLMVVAALGAVGYTIGLDKIKERLASLRGPAVVSSISDVVTPPANIEEKLEDRGPDHKGINSPPTDEVFTDADQVVDLEGTWGTAAIKEMIDKRVVTTWADGRFRPTMHVSRATVLYWIYNAIENQAVPSNDPFTTPRAKMDTVDPTGSEFRDVDANYWCAQTLATMKSAGLYWPEEMESPLRPDAPLTRQEWARLASLVAATRSQKGGLPKVDPDSPAVKQRLEVGYRKAGYTDAEKIPPRFRKYVFFVFADEKRAAWVPETFEPPKAPDDWEPGKAMTRAEAAAWLRAAYTSLGNGSF